MGSLNAQGKNCFQCSGLCCTADHNSMQVDPVQALELLAWLESQERLESGLIELLQKSISDFRLDKEFFVGRGRELRKHFTCPFFAGKAKGCSVSRYAKPYGCLGFNPYEANVSAPGKCASNLKTLVKRENAFSEREEKANEMIRNKLNLYWQKKNLPVALVETLKALGLTENTLKKKKVI